MRSSPRRLAVSRYLDDHVVKRMMRGLLRWGIAPKAFALLETTGRRSGLARQTPVGNGLIGDTFWLIAARGRKAHYVANLSTNPAVRVRIGRRWLAGVAQVLPDEDPDRRLADILAHHGWLRRWDARILASSVDHHHDEPMVVRITIAPGQTPDATSRP